MPSSLLTRDIFSILYERRNDESDNRFLVNVSKCYIWIAIYDHTRYY